MAHPTLHLWTLCLLFALAFSQTIDINAPSQPPASASNPVDRQFLGLMVESTSWLDYADDLSQNLTSNLLVKTGAPIIMRVGGTSGDQFVYNATQQPAIQRDNPNDHNLTANVTVGPTWMEGFTYHDDMRYILQVPLARNQLNKTVAFTKAAVQAIGVDNLEAIEIGNEPDLYVGQSKRPKGYDLSDWTQQFLQYADAISQNVDLPSGPIYQAGAFAWHPGHPQWDPQDAYSSGLSKNDRIKTFAMHYYQTHVGQSLNSQLLNHSKTISNTDTLKSSVNYIHANHPNVSFVLSEVGDSLGKLVGNEEQLDGVLGSALWEVDWLLYAMASSINRVNMNQCKRCNFASWWPAQSNPNADARVRAQYFGLALVADFLGGLDARFGPLLPLRVASLYNPTFPYLSPYAGYFGGKLDRYAVVELTEWNATSTEKTPRPVRAVTLDIPSDVVSAELRRLSGNGTDVDAGNMSYAGLRYSAANTNGEVVGPITEELAIKGGKVAFQLQASEAALVTLKRNQTGVIG